MGFQAVSLDDAPAIHGFRQYDGQVAGLAHPARGRTPHRAAQPFHSPGHKRKGQERQHSQLPVADQDIDEIAHQLHAFQEHSRETLCQAIAHQGRVIEKVGDELAGMNGIEIGQIAADQAGEHVALRGGNRLFGKRVQPHAAQEQADGPYRHDACRRQCQGQQPASLFVGEYLLEQQLDELRQKQAQSRRQQHAEDGKKQEPQIAADIVAQQATGYRARVEFGALGACGGRAGAGTHNPPV